MTKYLTIEIKGKLGNLLFEIISAWAIAKDNNYNFVLDKSFSTSRYYQIFFKNIKLINTNEENWKTIFIPNYKYMNLNISELESNIKINGYMQNTNFFNKYREIILKDFFDIESTLKLEPNNRFFIHIRLKDFLTSPIHNLELDNYYNSAIEYAKTKIDFNKTIFFICSDDIELASTKVYLELLPKENIVYLNNENEIETLRIIRTCNLGGIIPNSTFSWWGAYMILNPEKIIICPDKFLQLSNDYSGLYLDYKIINII